MSEKVITYHLAQPDHMVGLDLEIGTTGKCGGDAGHGGRLIFGLNFHTGYCCKIEYDPPSKGAGDCSFRIIAQGDAEIDQITWALKTAVQFLELMKGMPLHGMFSEKMFISQEISVVD